MARMTTRKLTRTLVAAVSAALLSTMAPGLATAQDLKICTVDLQAALASVNEGRQALESLTTELERRQDAINVQQTELEEWMAELETQIAVLSPEQRQERLEEYERRVTELQSAFQRNQQELSQAEIQATRQIADRMMIIVDEYASANGCTYVLQSSAVLFGPEDNDFTETLVSTYNDRH